MLLKKFSYLMMACLLTTFVVACDDDEVEDTTKPVVNLTSPTSDQIDAGFTAGGMLMVTGTVSDNMLVEEVKIKIEDASGEQWYDEEWDDIKQATYNLNVTIDIPETAAAGMHTMTLTAQDGEGNMATQEWEFEVMPMGNAMFTVAVPSSTPTDAQIFMVGSMTGNGADQDGEWELTRNEDGTYSGNFMMTENGTYRFRIKSNTEDADQFLEVGADCSAMAERQYTYSEEMQPINATVANWKNLGDCAE